MDIPSRKSFGLTEIKPCTNHTSPTIAASPSKNRLFATILTVTALLLLPTGVLSSQACEETSQALDANPNGLQHFSECQAYPGEGSHGGGLDCGGFPEESC